MSLHRRCDVALLDEIAREIVEVDHPEAPPDAQEMHDRVKAEVLSSAGGRKIVGYSVSEKGWAQTVTVYFSEGTGI